MMILKCGIVSVPFTSFPVNQSFDIQYEGKKPLQFDRMMIIAIATSVFPSLNINRVKLIIVVLSRFGISRIQRHHPAD